MPKIYSIFHMASILCGSFWLIWQATSLHVVVAVVLGGHHFLWVGTHVVAAFFDVTRCGQPNEVRWLAYRTQHILFTVNGVVRAVMLHGALEVGRHHAHADGCAIRIAHQSTSVTTHSGYMDRAARVQSSQHSIKLVMRRCQWLFVANFLLKDAFLESETTCISSLIISACRITKGNDATSKTVWVILGLHLELLCLVVHMNGMERVLVQMGWLVPIQHLLLWVVVVVWVGLDWLLCLQKLLLLLILLNGWELNKDNREG